MRKDFERCLLVQPCLIMGFQLLPFSIGHKFILHALGSPFVTFGNVISSDLATAIYVCSRTFEQGRESLFNPDPQYEQELINIGKRFVVGKLNEHVASFHVYLKNYLDSPGHWEPDKDRKRLRSPWELHIIRVLCTVYNCTLSEAWNMPLNTARAYYDVECEANGDESLVSDEEGSLIEGRQ